MWNVSIFLNIFLEYSSSSIGLNLNLYVKSFAFFVALSMFSKSSIISKYLETIDDHINLVRVSKKCRTNMDKFTYNPVSLTRETREFFPNLKIFYRYSEDDKMFEDDDRIILRKNGY